MAIMLYLFHNKIQRVAKEYPSELSAYRAGENWELLRKGNTFTVLTIRNREEKHRLVGLGTVDANDLLLGM
jgi:hypothetical protein